MLWLEGPRLYTPWKDGINRQGSRVNRWGFDARKLARPVGVVVVGRAETES
jgi:hypothetical protein